MSNSLFHTKIDSLPDDLKKQALDFIDTLIAKHKSSKKKTNRKKKEGPKFGFARGMFKMSKDFDEPLDDFKEYMY